MAMTKRTLKTADPIMVPKPISDSAKVPKSAENNSGADPPAAMRVAPATSMLRLSCRLEDISSRAGTKNSSQAMASARNMYKTPRA